MIYSNRPGVCHLYPLMYNRDHPEKPHVLLNCKITEQYKDLYARWDKERMQTFFGETYEALISYLLPWNEEYDHILKQYGHLFLDEIEVTPEQVAHYELKSFYNFLKKR